MSRTYTVIIREKFDPTIEQTSSYVATLVIGEDKSRVVAEAYGDNPEEAVRRLPSYRYELLDTQSS